MTVKVGRGGVPPQLNEEGVRERERERERENL